MFKCIVLALCLAASAPDLLAQAVQVRRDTITLDFNGLDSIRLRMAGTKALRGAAKFIVPTAILYLSVDGHPRPLPKGYVSIDPVTSEYRVLQLRKRFSEELALAVQSELVGMLRAQRLTTLVYEDIRSNALLPVLGRLRVDPAFNAPIVKTQSPRTTYAVVAPTAAQLFAGDPLNKHWAFKKLARESGAVVVVPELWFQAPQSRLVPPTILAEAFMMRVKLTTGMDLVQASLTFIAPNGSSCAISHLQPLSEVSDSVGTLDEMGRDSRLGDAPTGVDTSTLGRGAVIRLEQLPSPRFNNTFNYWNLSVAEDKYAAAVLRGARSFFTRALEIIELERRK